MFFGGPFGASAPMSQTEVDNKKFYEYLELTPDATSSDIKKAYRRLAIIHHPDKGGNQDRFKEISKAYEVLSDPEKRKRYDEYGEDSLDGAASDPSDIFDFFFGSSSRRGTRVKKTRDIENTLKVTLEQVYKGVKRNMAVNRNIICTGCKGNGGPSDAKDDCSSCHGTGVKTHLRNMGLVIQQSQSLCQNCGGKGVFILPSKRCKQCKGSGVVKERKVFEVNIEKGVQNGQRIVFEGESDSSPGEVPGNLVFHVEVQDHEVFKRINSNLLLEKDITLYEALTGYEILVPHLDDRKLVVKNLPDEITTPRGVKKIVGEGLPHYGCAGRKGDLYILFNVIFPTSNQLTEKKKASLATILPRPSPINYDTSDVNVYFHEAVDAKLEDASAVHGSAYEEDSAQHNPMGGSNVQCSSQ